VSTAATSDAADTDDATTPTTAHAHEDGPQLNPTGGAGHEHEDWTPEAILDPEVQAELSTEMANVRDLTMEYPTVADAEAAGFRPVGNFAAGSGAHYLRPDVMTGGVGGLGTFDAAKPIIYLYAGNDPTSPVVGVMYYLFGDEPDGFPGPNDHWHQHTGLCLAFGGGAIDIALPVDQDATKAQCDEVHGMYMGTTGWMIHVWSAAGWEAPEGVFAHDNSLLVCTDGTPPEDVTLDKGCQGMSGL
jgi:hypothetical protein